MNAITFADVVAVFAHSSFGQFLLALTVGYSGYVAVAWYRLRRPKPSPTYDPIPVIVHPFVITLAGSGRKGFEHKGTVVSLAERRRDGRMH